MIERPRGTRDMFPEEMEKRRSVENTLRDVVENFGYGEIMTPSFEHTRLFMEKSGPNIVDEIYAFEDKGGRKIALRPEFTASVMRMYHEGMRERPKPVKLYYFGSVFRYERPQSGRYREFWHFGTELIGPDTPMADAENIALAHECLRKLGLDDFELRLSNLRILSTFLQEKGVPENKMTEIFHQIDKGDLDKLGEYEFGIELLNLLQGEKMEDHLENKEPVEYLYEVLRLLEHYGISPDDYRVDLRTVRGLDYYQGMVFEIDSGSLGAEKQICGGGDYKLGSIFGTDVSAKGFAFGFDRVVLALGEAGGSVPQKRSCYVIPIGEETRESSLRILRSLRDEGITADIDLMERGVGKALSYAHKTGFTTALMLGENEMNRKEVGVKDLISGEQCMVPEDELVAFFKCGT